MSTSRRRFLKTSAAVSLVCLTGNAFGKDPKKLRFAQIGCGGRGGGHHGMWRQNEFIAACDTNRRDLDRFSKSEHPKLRKYTNYQEMYEKEMDNIDAVIVATPDHNHYAASMLGLMNGKAVYCEKPLAWSVWECLELAKMAKKKKVATQMGNQGNAGNGWCDCYSIIHSDIIGKVKEVKTWTNRPIWPQGNNRPEGQDPIPHTLDWNSWIGVAPMRPYKSNIQPFKWRGFYDFGCGALGDMACHTMNAMFQVMKPEFDLTVEPVMVEGRSDDQFPKKQIIKWSFAKAGKCPGFDGYWYDGNLKPDKPEAMGEDHKLPNTGSMFIGTKGVMVSASDYNNSPVVYIDGKVVKPKVDQLIKPAEGGIHGNFLDSASGKKPWDASVSNFMYAGKITAIINMGTLAEQLDKKLTFSSKTMKFDDDKATRMMNRKPRRGWGKAYKV